MKEGEPVGPQDGTRQGAPKQGAPSSPRDTPSPRDPLRSIRVATYNIHGAVGAGWPRAARPDRIAAVLREIDADVVGLQEVSTQPGRMDGQLFRIAEAAGYRAVPGGAMRDHRGDYGNALLLREAPSRVINHPLRDGCHGRIGKPEPRGALEARVTLGGRTIRVFATHLGLSGSERIEQADRLLDALELDNSERDDVDAIVVLGDLNDPTGRGRAVRRLERALGAQPAPRSFPARIPLIRLDRILAHPAHRIADIAVHDSPLARRASDHLPVVATLRLGAGE